ncbi:DUF2877 domain-containing protein [Melaminivora alkalimesophila]|uniref:DUF2877 domain-containing protein n=1 Tax=Melaminivora alkalimesophila TaxID=1165852 RepID=UPI000683E1A5
MLPITCVPSRYVARLLPHIQGSPLQLHSLFERSLNLFVGSRLLLTIQVASLGHSPFGVVVGETVWPALRRRLASAAEGDLSVMGRALLMGGHPLLTIPAAHGYDERFTPLPPQPNIFPARHLHQMLLEAKGDGQAGLATLLEGWSPGGQLRSVTAVEPWLVRAQPVLKTITAGDGPALVEAARRLIGLGPGLTPSGDDFVVGFVGALWLDGQTNMVRYLRRHLREHLWQATNVISAQYLRHALHGRFSSPLRSLLEAMIQGEPDSRQLMAALRGVMAVGSSSGWDSLMGVLAGLYWREQERRGS